MLKFYGYKNCSSCRKAEKALVTAGVEYQYIDITTKPPTKKLLSDILKAGEYTLKQLFNTSGVQYRELKIKDQLPGLSEAKAVALLAGNGKLCKRPMVTDGSQTTVGYRENVFASVWC
ncbi:MAG: Spx/MgsR family RNA polymerase-binding regulatory protein [Polyangiaceae bacterium]|nr:Spx/MgsR family RNA polymerase-binding regulatory protein [Polyangiaceae bacterium]